MYRVCDVWFSVLCRYLFDRVKYKAAASYLCCYIYFIYCKSICFLFCYTVVICSFLLIYSLFILLRIYCVDFVGCCCICDVYCRFIFVCDFFSLHLTIYKLLPPRIHLSMYLLLVWLKKEGYVFKGIKSIAKNRKWQK